MDKTEYKKQWKERTNPWIEKSCRICDAVYRTRFKSKSKTCKSCRSRANTQKIRYTITCKACGKHVSAVNSRKEYCDTVCFNKKYFPGWSKDNVSRQEYDKSYYVDNKEARRKYYNNKYNTDIEYRLKKNLRSRLNKALKRDTKTGSAVRDLGCSIGELKTYLEAKFTDGMNWGNYGEWHIDHIMPLSAFMLSNPEELKKAVHYTNLQPLWEEDNLKKRDKIPCVE